MFNRSSGFREARSGELSKRDYSQNRKKSAAALSVGVLAILKPGWRSDSPQKRGNPITDNKTFDSQFARSSVHCDI
jgi:hypothetical protein